MAYSTVVIRLDAPQDELDRRILFAATGSGNYVVQHLLDIGASIEAIDHRGQTPLSLCAYADKYISFKALLDRGAKIDTVCRAGKTPLHYAAEKGRLEFVRELVERNANLFVKSNADMTAYDAAIQNNFHEVAGYLKSAMEVQQLDSLVINHEQSELLHF